MDVPCMNCTMLISRDDLRVVHNGYIIGGVCGACLDDTKKARVTLQRATAYDTFRPEQFDCVEAFALRGK